MTNPPFTGVAAALVTLFTDDLEVDVGATAALAGRLVDAGLSAILVAGSTGEAAALTAPERAALLTAVVAEVGDRVPVLAGTGAPSARQAVALTRGARDAGAAAALVLSPPSASDPRPYYDTVAKEVPDLALLAYHYPGVSAPGVPLDVLDDLPVVGLKDSSGDPDRLLTELTSWDRPVYPGSSALVAYAGILGCPGAILALANAEPERCVAAFAGDGTAQLELVDAHSAQRGSFPQGIKALTARRFGTSTASRMG
ncbi:MAG TPA: dihydrodipicolinate synthase family protein [Acidimicrobiales bacterium]|nr:dihydrodipicolinate synthase family protein [Acidimicrobiales bacterium]